MNNLKPQYRDNLAPISADGRSTATDKGKSKGGESEFQEDLAISLELRTVRPREIGPLSC